MEGGREKERGEVEWRKEKGTWRCLYWQEGAVNYCVCIIHNCAIVFRFIVVQCFREKEKGVTEERRIERRGTRMRECGGVLWIALVIIICANVV